MPGNRTPGNLSDVFPFSYDLFLNDIKKRRGKYHNHRYFQLFFINLHVLKSKVSNNMMCIKGKEDKEKRFSNDSLYTFIIYIVLSDGLYSRFSKYNCL